MPRLEHESQPCGCLSFQLPLQASKLAAYVAIRLTGQSSWDSGCVRSVLIQLECSAPYSMRQTQQILVHRARSRKIFLENNETSSGWRVPAACMCVRP
jgi:hypothetical protein